MKRELLHEKGAILFAPYVFESNMKLKMLITYGLRKDMCFEDKLWRSNRDNSLVERWYVGGKNRIRICQLDSNNKWEINQNDTFDFHKKFLDVMGACFIENDLNQWIWFSGKEHNGTWSIFVSTRRIQGDRWSEPQVAIFPDMTTDCQHTYLPSVLYDNGYFHLWYAGRDGNNRRIHYAVSRDGIEWIKKGVVLDCGALGELDEYACDCPSVIKYGNKFIMAYGGGTARCVMLATSDNGYRWEKLGPVTFRGDKEALDYAYAFYPCLYVSSIDNSIELYYSGENRLGEWSILYFGKINNDYTNKIAKSYKPDINFLRDIDKEIRNIPHKYLSKENDSNSFDNVYISKKIKQIRPSSTPVFRISDKENDSKVVKLGRSRFWVENEYRGYLKLKKYITHVPMALRYINQKPLLIMPYIKGSNLASYASSNSKKFIIILDNILNKFVKLTKKTIIKYSEERISYSLQTPDVLMGWLQEVIRHSKDKIFSYRLIDNTTKDLGPMCYEFESARNILSYYPKWVAYFSGDNHFKNFIVTDDLNYLMLDFEFSGYLDIDYSVAKFIGSAIKHLGAFENISVKICDERKEIQVNYNFISIELRNLLTTTWLKEHFKDIPVNYERVQAYVMSKLIFRLEPIWKDGQSYQRDLGIVMLSCASRLFKLLIGDDNEI
ncbi:hypothetical protein HZI73_16785 [Vallitalea pronyensis]|uniref:Glycosyl hydrolase family 32 N-terminal domain-containing protein n=1 Tax=Vallitalea pronyensis TaxID=1348613 RepID=A0A8J8SHW5_9FIRM|nr:hypothetical protein [Vallitalea pronyensis]QUI23848.1 hypothetical protein HZI73_16785 [Vallitalea pronyensis]